MQKNKHTIGILGGTFDPVHNGHIQLALALQKKLGLQEIKFVPCKLPVLKAATQASVDQRLAMLKLALAPYPNLTIDTRELDRNAPSYMVLTLASLRDEHPDAALALIMAMDAFLELPAWHQWQKLVDYAHIIVASRAGYLLPKFINDSIHIHTATAPTHIPQLLNFLKTHQTHTPQQINQQPAGLILLQSLDIAPISSTAIRKLAHANTVPKDWLPENVLNYIKQHHLYQGDNNENKHR